MLRPRAGKAEWRRAAAGALLGFAALFPVHAQAQSAESDSVSARVQAAILDPGTIAKTADMNFGQIVQPNTAGTIVMSAQASAACTPSGGLVRTGVCRAAAFTIRARRNGRVRIRQNNGGVVTLNGPAGATMTMDAMNIGVTGMTSVNGGNGWDFGNWRITDSTGIANLYVGGTLHVGAAQTPGTYTGTLLIQIQFN